LSTVQNGKINYFGRFWYFIDFIIAHALSSTTESFIFLRVGETHEKNCGQVKNYEVSLWTTLYWEVLPMMMNRSLIWKVILCRKRLRDRIRYSWAHCQATKTRVCEYSGKREPRFVLIVKLIKLCSNMYFILASSSFNSQVFRWYVVSIYIVTILLKLLLQLNVVFFMF